MHVALRRLTPPLMASMLSHGHLAVSLLIGPDSGLCALVELGPSRASLKGGFAIGHSRAAKVALGIGAPTLVPALGERSTSIGRSDFPRPPV